MRALLGLAARRRARCFCNADAERFAADRTGSELDDESMDMLLECEGSGGTGLGDSAAVTVAWPGKGIAAGGGIRAGDDMSASSAELGLARRVVRSKRAAFQKKRTSTD